jgi:hypothetical protein
MIPPEATMKKTKNALLLAAVVLALGAGLMGLAGDAAAQATTGPSGPPTGGVPGGPPNKPTIPTTPPVVVKPVDKPVDIVRLPPPPVVIETPKTPTPPPGMFTNLPSDMRSMTGLGSVASIDRLLTAPVAIDLSLPRQAVTNRLEKGSGGNRNATQRAADESGLGAAQLIDKAKPLI